MIETVRSRFRDPGTAKGGKGKGVGGEVGLEGMDGAVGLDGDGDGDAEWDVVLLDGKGEEKGSVGLDSCGRQVVEVEKREVRKRKG